MSDITLSSAVRSNLLSLQNTADLLAQTQERLATGLEVNSALDNPTNFFTASSLNGRAGDLSRLLDGISNATQTLEAADNGISAITTLVESAQASARQALQAPGEVTESKIEGLTSASFNPASLSSVQGDNLNNLSADASASIDFLSVADDTANIAAITTGDLDTGATDGAGLLSDTGTDGPALVATDSITLNVNGTDYTLSFDASTAAGAARTGDSVNGFDVTIGVDQNVNDLTAAFNTLLSGSGVTVAGTDDLTFSFSADVDTVELSDNTTNGGTLTKLGLNGEGIDVAATGGDTGDRLLARNAAFGAEIAARGSATVDVALGNATPTTLTIGSGPGEISTKAGLNDALNAISGVQSSYTGAGAITVTTSDSNNASDDITFQSSTADLNSFLDFDVAGDDGGADVDVFDAGTITTTAGAENLLSQANGPDQGDVLSIKVGNSTTLALTFGTGANEIDTIGKLNAALEDLAGGAASVDGDGEINITADNAGDTIEIGGSSNARAAFGLEDARVGNLFNGQSNSLLDGTNLTQGDTLSLQVGTNNALNITFGTGESQVNSLQELEDALGNLAGGRAEIDGTTGAISIEATNGTEDITVTTNRGGGAQASIAEAFGLPTVNNPTSETTSSTERSELRGQYNELLIQIDELAEDSGFNGVNLLNGDDLQVIFNEDGSSTLDIDGVNFDSSSLGLSRLNTNFFQNDSNIENTLDTLDNVINTLRSQSSKFGSNLSVVETRENFTNDMINTLETGAANLTLADSNEEGANLTALQTRQTLSTTALSLATQSDQNVLRLF
ncbi:MAG: flagellin [Pseudomonadota bacterium]